MLSLSHSADDYEPPVHYMNQTNAWCTKDIFNEFLKQVAKDICVSAANPACLILDNCRSHDVHAADSIEGLELIFLPPNTTSKLQPLDQGIISSVKRRYRYQVRFFCRSFDIDMATI